MRTKKLLLVLLSALLVVSIFGCSKEKSTEPKVVAFDVVREALDNYLSSGQAPVISAQALFDNMNDGDTSNDYFVVSVRKPEHYKIGHIPGAINIFFKDVAKADNLKKIPKDKKVVTYCYTGHTGMMAATALNAMGWEAYDLKFGIMAWTKNADARVQSAFSEDTDAHDYPVETKVNTASATHKLPSLSYITATDKDEIIRQAADHALSTMTPVITAQALYDLLNDGDTSNDPIIVSVRKPEHYAIGHIPGAINIFFRDIAKEDNLKKLDPDKQIVTYCYTGHTGEIAATALAMLGYNATNLKFGIMSWTKDANVRVQSAFSEDTDAHDYPLHTGTNP